MVGDDNLTKTQFEPLVEFGSLVTMEFRGRSVPAYSDVASGYVFFEPPLLDELNDYYQREYPRMQAKTGYYTIEADYAVQKNGYYADRILSVYTTIMRRPPRSALELGCAYGGLVATMRQRGVAAQGADINATAIKQGRVARGNENLIHADNLAALAQMPGKVDLIYSIGSLEHDAHMLRVIAECRERLSSYGLLFLMIPNAMFAGSVFGGFKNNWWVNYPQHLHMLSPGFIPSMCQALGFLPLFWDTQTLFEGATHPSVLDLFNKRQMTPNRRELWSTLLLGAGLGMELNFAIAPDTPESAFRFYKVAQEVHGTLEHSRRQEVKIRQSLKTASP